MQKWPVITSHQPLFTALSFFGFHSMQGWAAPTRHGVTKKEVQKGWSIQEISLEKAYSQKASVNSRLKAIKIIGERKEFSAYRLLFFEL